MISAGRPCTCSLADPGYSTRKRLHIEIMGEDGSVNTDPVLLVRNHDDQYMYDQKVILQGEVRLLMDYDFGTRG